MNASDLRPANHAPVITAANTFIATAEAISFTGARPVFVDIDPITYNLDPTRIEDAIMDMALATTRIVAVGKWTQNQLRGFDPSVRPAA